MKTKLFLSAAALVLTSVGYAQDNPMTHYPSNYGESYKSIAFDGTRNANFTSPALYFAGRTYAIWGDTWGDIVVGSIDNKSGKVETDVLFNDKMLSIDDYTASMAISDGGVVTVFVAGACKCGSIAVCSSKTAGSVADWYRTSIPSHDLSIKQIYAVSGTSLLVLDNDGALYSIQMSGSKWLAPVKVDAPKADQLDVVQSASGELAFIIGSDIYTYADGAVAQQPKVAGDVADVAFSSDNKLNVLYQSNGAYYLQNGDSKRAEKLPLKGSVKEAILDHETPNTIYYTTVLDSVAEINSIAKSGRRWVNSDVTVDTPHNNRALVAVVGAPANSPVQICWLQETTKDVKVNPLTALKVDILQPEVNDTFDKEQIKTLMGKVADWQLTYSFTGKSKRDWHWGAFYEGLVDAYEVTGDGRYFEEMMNVGEYFNWELEPDVFHADRLIICDIFAYLYEKTGRKYPEMINPTRWAMDLHTTRKSKIEPQYKGANNKYEWWTWCDALYMAPPSFYTYSKMTGDPAAMNFAYQQWQDVADYLYSEENSLFFRDDRYFNAVSSNGGKVFWARGNGWVFGAIPRILETLPAGHPHRAYYENMFREIAAKLLELQRAEGLWTVSLLDPEELLRGESSGSAFYGYGFAWGVNNGVLDAATYGPAAKKAWKALSANVSQFGRLGYVQQVAGSPYPFYEDQAHTYASGTFLMFANQMLKMK